MIQELLSVLDLLISAAPSVAIFLVSIVALGVAALALWTVLTAIHFSRKK